MSKIPVLSSKQVIKTLRTAGFEDAPKKGKGSHIALMKRDPKRLRLIIVPRRKSLPRGTLHAILDQAGLTRAEFLSLVQQ